MKSVNPATGEVLRTFEPHDPAEVERRVQAAASAFGPWSARTFDERAHVLWRCGVLLRERAKDLGALMTSEMGKPLDQAVAEVTKCAMACDHYAEHAASLLAMEAVNSKAPATRIAYEPLGVILSIMPWNFPFWQVWRFAAPALMAGNTVLVKHAPNVLGCSEAIVQLARDAGVPAGVLDQVRVDVEGTGALVEHPAVAAVTLTGSDRAGRSVAARAGKALKKTVLELGGSDPFIVLPDADLEHTVAQAVAARCQNSGQSCCAAKRFVVHRDIAEAFLGAFVQAMRDQVVGDPTHPDTAIGPLARQDLRDQLHEQVRASVAAGALVACGCEPVDGPGWFYPPTVLVDVPEGSPAADEELFGPVAAVFVVDSEDQAIRVANHTRFGLAASLWTEDREHAMDLARRIQAGGVFVNSMPFSDPRQPFGGVKDSGYGRELGLFGIREFVNVKTLAVF